jgi:hypothetical protein
LLWPSSRGGRPRVDDLRFAYLFDEGQAVPKLPLTPARAAALEQALEARQTCPECGQHKEYVLSTRLAMCNDCAAAEGLVP